MCNKLVGHTKRHEGIVRYPVPRPFLTISESRLPGTSYLIDPDSQQPTPAQDAEPKYGTDHDRIATEGIQAWMEQDYD